jgi:hypothetical protein
VNDPKLAPNAIADESGNIIGWASKWNPVGLGECIVQFTDGSMDSAYFRELNFPNGEEAARQLLDSREP